MLSKSNSFTLGKYIFQPTKYDKNGNLYCALYRLKSHNKKVCKITGLYNFEEEKFELIFIANGWMDCNHKKLLKFILKQYDWDF